MTNEFIAAQVAWGACMRRAGKDVSSDDDVRMLLIDQLNEFPLLYPDEQDQNPYVISDETLADLVQFELEVFNADQTCRSQAGLDDLDVEMQEQVVNQLRAEFGFEGVSDHG